MLMNHNIYRGKKEDAKLNNDKLKFKVIKVWKPKWLKGVTMKKTLNNIAFKYQPQENVKLVIPYSKHSFLLWLKRKNVYDLPIGIDLPWILKTFHSIYRCLFLRQTQFVGKV